MKADWVTKVADRVEANVRQPQLSVHQELVPLDQSIWATCASR
jgi:hypothetical protein